MFERILVPLDGSPRAEQALPVAAKLARATGGSLVLLHVTNIPLDYRGSLSQAPFVTEKLREEALASARSYLGRVAASADLAGLTIKTEVAFGPPARHILAVVKSRRVELIVMCSHGRTGFTRWALGSVTHQVVHRSPVPVFVLREEKSAPLLSCAEAAHPLCALVPLDGSLLAETALLPAVNLVAALAAPAHGSAHLTQVVKLLAPIAEIGLARQAIEEALKNAEMYLSVVEERLQETVRDLELSMTWSVALDTDIADALIGIAEYVEEGKGPEGFAGCNMIAMATHGHGGVERWVMGSVTERVLNATQLPVLVVRPRKEVIDENTSESVLETA
jgi:nucleotide-binding universal stress UspA family protein